MTTRFNKWSGDGVRLKVRACDTCLPRGEGSTPQHHLSKPRSIPSATRPLQVPLPSPSSCNPVITFYMCNISAMSRVFTLSAHPLVLSKRIFISVVCLERFRSLQFPFDWCYTLYACYYSLCEFRLLMTLKYTIFFANITKLYYILLFG